MNHPTMRPSDRGRTQPYVIAHYLLLATVLTTVINIILLFAQADLAIPYCASFPYYLTYFGYLFDDFQVSTYTTTGMVMTFVCLCVYLLIWYLARNRTGWLITGMILVILDAVFLALFALLFFENPSSCLVEVLLHLAVIYQIGAGLYAERKMKQQATQVIAPPEDPDAF